MNKLITFNKFSKLAKTIIGIGSPLLDIQAEVSTAFLQKYGFSLNNTYFADEEADAPLYEEMIAIPTHSHVPGGSALNTIRLAQWMLQGEAHQVKFIGCVGKDKFADMLIQATIKDKVTPLFDQQQYPTGKCAVLLNNKDRCLVPLIGAAAYLTKQYVDQHIQEIKNATILFSEGYFLYPQAELTKYIYATASQNGVTTCLSLSSLNTVMEKFDDLVELMPYVDYLFGNKNEMEQFAINLGYPLDFYENLKQIAQFPKHNSKKRVIVCTQGVDPTVVSTKDSQYIHDVNLIDYHSIIDTNSAGDSFCGGQTNLRLLNYSFISQLLNDKDIQTCVRAGNYSASQTVQQEGSTLPAFKPNWE